MRVLVTGDREWTDYPMIKHQLEELASVYDDALVIIHGAARGADSLANAAAIVLGLPVHAYPAEWEKYGKAAGPVRNLQMLAEGKPDLVLAFHDDLARSKGTANMVKQAKAHGVEVRLFSHVK